MTLTQLEAFVLVARLGSVKAAAKVLGVSEPAVSGALAALRQHLGDPLLQRSPTGMDLTPGGKRLVAIASQMVNLAVEAEAAIRDAQGAPELLRVVAASTVADMRVWRAISLSPNMTDIDQPTFSPVMLRTRTRRDTASCRRAPSSP